MKKKVLIISIIIVVGIGIVLGIIRELRKIEIIDLVPAEAILYLETTDLARTYSNLKKSRFWKEAGSLKVWEKVRSSEKWKRLTEHREELESQTGLKFNESNLKELAGKQVGFALFKSALGGPDVLFLTEVGIKREIMNILPRFRKKGGQRYKGLKVDVIETRRLKLYYLFINNIAVLATDISILERVVDIYRGEKAYSLVEEERFKEVKSRLPLKSKGLVYFERERFARIFLPLIQERKTKAEKVFSSGEFIEAGGGELLLNPRGVRVESYLLFREGALSEDLLKMYRMKPRRFRSLEFIPQNSLLYGVENALDIKILYNSLLQNWEKEEKTYENIKKKLARFEEKFGIKIEEDLLSCLNGEIAYTIPEIDLKGPFPSPKIAFLLGIKEKEKWAKILSKFEEVIARQGKLKIEKKEYGGIEISFVRLPLVSEGLRPAYALVNDFFILNTSTSSLEEMIKVYQSKSNLLAESDSFEVAKASFTKGAKGLYYLDLERSLNISLEALQNFSPLLFKKEEEKKRLEEVIYPLIKLARVLKALGISVTRDEEGIKEVFFCSIEDLPPQSPKK
jgi:hypothetical protein